MQEMRLFPRVWCEFTVYDTSFKPIGKAIDISFGGILVKGNSLNNGNEKGQRTLQFYLNEKEPVRVEATVLRETTSETGEKLTAYSFSEFLSGADDLISKYVISSLWKNVLGSVDNGSAGTGGFFSEIEDKEKIDALILSAYKECVIIFCVQASGEKILQLKLQAIGNETLSFTVEDNLLELQLIDKDNIYFYFTVDHTNYLIYLEHIEIDGQSVIIPTPQIVFSCSRRSEKREGVKGQNIAVSIPLPYPAGATLQREVIDISTKGLAFHNPIDEFYLLPGTPITNLKVIGKKEFLVNAEIRHITPVVEDGKESYLKIGVFFPERKVGLLTGTVEKVPPKRAAGFVKSGTGIFKDLVHCMKGLAVQSVYLAQKGMTLRSNNHVKGPRVNIIRIKNRNNEEIVGILNTTWESKEKRDVCVIIIPPAFGKRKESTGPLAIALIENFKRVREDIAVIRYDGIRNLGESYKEAVYREQGREAVGMTLSQYCDDLETVVAFSRDNEYFNCQKLVLLTFSISALSARRLLAQNKLGNVDLWIAGMGMPCAQEVLTNVSGGIDYIGNLKKGINAGEITLLGINIDTAIFCKDALDNKMADVEDAVSDMEKISTPVDWILGNEDAWIDSSQVEELINAHKLGKGKLHTLKMGHVPMTGLESIRLFQVIIKLLFKSILQKEITPIFPLPSVLEDIRIREWERTSKYPLTNPENYWAGYLLGEEDDNDGYDVLCYCDDYNKFLEDEVKALDLNADCKVADMGCGTGNFGQLLIKDYLQNGDSLPDLTIVDLVHKALDRVQEKYSRLLGDLSNKRMEFKRVDLEINLLIPVKQFLEGKFYSMDKFKGKINGLFDDTIELWKEYYSELLHQILRGKILTANDNQYLKGAFAQEEINFIKDMNLASRFIKGLLTKDDFRESIVPHLDGVNTSELNFNKFNFGNCNLDFKLPFEDNKFDRILSSLVLCYLKNPHVTFSEFVRCLKPGGKIVISTMMPDMDMSIMYTNLIKKIELMEDVSEENREDLLKSARTLANRMSVLLTLVEECQFRFFSKEEMLEFAEENNLKDITVTESYGNPPQAYILSGVK